MENLLKTKHRFSVNPKAHLQMSGTRSICRFGHRVVTFQYRRAEDKLRWAKSNETHQLSVVAPQVTGIGSRRINMGVS